MALRVLPEDVDWDEDECIAIVHQRGAKRGRPAAVHFDENAGNAPAAKKSSGGGGVAMTSVGLVAS